MSAIFGMNLVTNEDVRGYQIQLKAEGKFPIGFIAREAVASKLRGEDRVILMMGSVVSVKHFKQLCVDVHKLEKIGFKPVGAGSDYHPTMVLNDKKIDLEANR